MTTPNIPAHLTVRAARDRYLAHYGFTMTAYTAPTFEIPLLGFKLRLPNGKARQAAIARHDLHHVACGYATDYAGEGEISVWELRGGCNTPFLWAINLAGMLLGLCVAPRRTWRAWRAAKGARTLYVAGIDPEAALAMTVLELRRRLGVPDAGYGAGEVARADAAEARA